MEDMMNHPHQPPYWLSIGLRPFFFLGALAMAASVLVWIPILMGAVELPTAFTPRDWHVHTLFFGGVAAIIAGFALTAVSNWTGRPPVAGRLLLALVLLWGAGRMAVSTSAIIGPLTAAIIDMTFPVMLVTVFAREVIVSRNYRNLRIVALVGAFGLANLCFHLESFLTGTADHAMRAAVSIVLLMIMLVGGRIIPAFTRNWLKMRGAVRLPAEFSRLDGATMLIAAVSLACWIVVPAATATGWLFALTGLAAALRLSRWRGLQTTQEPLLFVLHVAYATIPAGFALMSLAVFDSALIDPVSAVHVWTAGTVGLMTLAVMTRASRGHSGRTLVAGPLEVTIYALAIVGAGCRLAAGFASGHYMAILEMAALAWALAFLVFALGYFPKLFRPAGVP
uniref:NnrS family protein n=1 Tax=Stappia sp. TaxID=1870903 RepID=UPI003BA967DE